MDVFPIVLGIVLAPLITCLVGVAGLMGTGWWRHALFGKILNYLTIVASAASLMLSFLLIGYFKFPNSLGESITKTWPDYNFMVPVIGEIHEFFLLDALSVYFIFLVNLIALFVSWRAIFYLQNRHTDGTARRESPAFFHTFINLFHVTMVLVPLFNNLVGLWIAIEATTLVSTLLVSFENRRESWEAAWKYLIITSTGIIFALLGTMLLAHAAADLVVESNSIMNWTFLLEKAQNQSQSLDSDSVKLAFLFILVGYGAKAGLAPLHTWLPDGHGEAPPPISALLSGVLLKSAMYAILRFYVITNATLQDKAAFTSAVLLGAGLLSLVVATPFILKEKNYFKRVLAYHSLEHMGIITMGIGIGGEVALFGALLHIFNHALTKSLMFLSFGHIINRYEQAAGVLGRVFKPTQITGVLRSMPITGGILTLGGLALVGMPPFNIFYSEFIIMWGAIQLLAEDEISSPLPSWIIIVTIVLFILSTTLIFFGLVGHLSRLVLGKMPVEWQISEGLRPLWPLIILFLLVIWFGLGANPLSELINQSVKIVAP